MLRCASPRFSSLNGLKSPRFIRHFHQVTTIFVDFDPSGNLDPKKNLSFAIRAVSPVKSAIPSADGAGDRCQLTFFHDSQHFGFASGPSSYPRLYVPIQMPRQKESNSSPAALSLSGKMHEIVLDGTPDAKFAENASASVQSLEPVLRQLKDM
ncbi:hypothetical protein N7488_003001 [Penicillium malachiteum]|nr:hypothetical protein N7488_003001 [Penicillium malachiteum]